MKWKCDLKICLEMNNPSALSKSKNQIRNEHLAKYNGRLVVLPKEDTE